MIAALFTALMLLAWLATMASVAVSHYLSTRERLALLNREAQVASAENRVGTYRQGLDSVASDLAKRQDVIEKLVQAHVGDLPSDVRPGETVSDSNSEAVSRIARRCK